MNFAAVAQRGARAHLRRPPSCGAMSWRRTRTTGATRRARSWMRGPAPRAAARSPRYPRPPRTIASHHVSPACEHTRPSACSVGGLLSVNPQDSMPCSWATPLANSACACCDAAPVPFRLRRIQHHARLQPWQRASRCGAGAKRRCRPTPSHATDGGNKDDAAHHRD